MYDSFVNNRFYALETFVVCLYIGNINKNVLMDSVMTNLTRVISIRVLFIVTTEVAMIRFRLFF